MKVRFFGLLLAAIFCLPSAADVRAADMILKAPPLVYVPAWYIEGRIGTGIDPEYDFNTPAAGLTSTYAPSGGWYGALAIGRYLRPNWRAELELSYGTGRRGTAAGLAHRGSFNSVNVMGNLLYNFSNVWAFTPFVGVGLGAAFVDTNNLGAIGGAFVLNDSDVALAGALIAGLDYRLNPRWTATARYTGLYTGSMSFASVPAGFTTRVDSGFTHLFSVGARYAY